MTLSVEVQPRDGGWVTLGTQNSGGVDVFPESIEYSGDLSEYGCLDAMFRLKLDPRWNRQIIEHFTPVVIKDGGEDVWSGRIIQAPTTFGEDAAEVVVQAEGWGQHTKDDPTDREWVIDDLSRLDDYRSVSGAPLDKFTAAAQVTNGEGMVALAWPNGSTLPAPAYMGVRLDCGPGNLASRVVMEYESSANATDITVYCDATGLGGANTFFSPFTLTAGGASGTKAGTATTPGRYVTLFLYRPTGGATGAEVYFRIKRLIVFTDAADESGNASALKASTVVSEVVAACCPLYSTDTSKISATATSIPNFPGSPGWKYPNELIDKANSLHGWVARLSPQRTPVFEFSAMPTDYSYVVGAGEYTLAEPAAFDGRPVYSRVITEYEDAAGVRSYASAIDPSSGAVTVPSSSQPANPSFATDVSSWAVHSPQPGTITRDTALFHTTPASAKLTTGTGGQAGVDTPLIGLSVGRRYRAAVMVNVQATSSGDAFFGMHTSSGAVNPNYLSTYARSSVKGSWQELAVDFVATASTMYAQVVIASAVSSYAMNFDTVMLYEFGASPVDRRGFRRTALRPMQSRSTAATAQAIAQLEFDNSQAPPFKGTLVVKGRIRTKGGSSVPVSTLPSRVGDAIRIDNLRDPNTGGLGRQGIIRAAKYVADTDECQLTIDSADGFVEILRNRLLMATG